MKRDPLPELGDAEDSGPTVLHRFVFANLEVPADEAMYFRLGAGAWAELGEQRLHFDAGSVVSSDTFYNGLTIGTWKRRCDVAALSLRLRGSGDVVLTLGQHRFGQASLWHAEHRLTLAPGTEVELPLPFWPALHDGMLFFRLRGLSAGTLDEAAYVTSDRPARQVRLGIVITHFNRQAQVVPAIGRIERALLARPGLRDLLTLTVVDNSRNLGLASSDGITVIANRNLGGTGGFVRGLLSLIDGGRHTHALFMDDDASCETESIARCLALLQYARSPTLAIAGALLRELEPWRLLEKGARFPGKVEPLSAGLDVRNVVDLLAAERNPARPDYGAWWFFAFPIAAVRRFPFPFFVRGDDVSFGLDNGFDIVTLNGIACFGEDFSAKHGPLTAYLDARYHLVLALLAQRGTPSRVFWVGSRLFVKPLTSYLYSSARAVTLALRHTLEGPDFFRQHLEMAAVRSEIAAWPGNEKMIPIDRAAVSTKGPRRRPESAVRRLARVLTLQGFLLPPWLLADRTLVQDKAFHGRASDVFRFRRVLYLHPATGEGYLARFDRRRFFAELGSFLRAWATVFRRLGDLRKAYAEGAATMTTIDFWRTVYAAETARSPRAAATAPAAGPPQGHDPASTGPGQPLENR